MNLYLSFYSNPRYKTPYSGYSIFYPHYRNTYISEVRMDFPLRSIHTQSGNQILMALYCHDKKYDRPLSLNKKPERPATSRKKTCFSGCIHSCASEPMIYLLPWQGECRKASRNIWQGWKIPSWPDYISWEKFPPDNTNTEYTSAIPRSGLWMTFLTLMESFQTFLRSSTIRKYAR